MRSEESQVLAPQEKTHWRIAGPMIWRPSGDDNNADPARSILRTLFDQPRWLEAYHLYDRKGSQLFERICELPEYYLTRTENAILAREAAEIIAAAPVDCIVELGAGYAKKTLHLLREQVLQRRAGTFAPIDVSLEGLAASRDVTTKDFPELRFCGLQAQFENALAGIRRDMSKLFVFLGSTIGNLTRFEFIRFFEKLSQSMGPKDYLLLGVDRLKDAAILEQAYNDAQGVTAEFILNVFENINRITGSNFDLRKMNYHCRYNSEWRQVEMYAESAADQRVDFPLRTASLVWPKGDRILVEISRKFDPTLVQKQLKFFGFHPIRHSTDSREWFSVLLCQKENS